ncbi:MULE transposase domain [Sesbania bispinosa]|nr:MULE transposase domain [Sesbania bispinosa]
MRLLPMDYVVMKKTLPKRIDYPNAFTTNEIFGNQDDLLKWVCDNAMTHGFTVVILRSDAGGKGRKAMLRGRPLHTDGRWRLNVVCGLHNHDVAENLEGQAYVGRLSAREMSLLNGLLTLKNHNKDNVTTIKQVYNVRQAFRASQRGHRTEWQHLMKLMERDKYLPLVEIVGVISTELTFSVAFAYMEQARLDNFTWVLEKLRTMILRSDTSPQVIVTNKDTTLMNAVEKVFPMSAHLLCQFHIARNVKAKFAWINMVMHLGTTTTNRVESAHSRLNNLLQGSQGDFCNCWDAMNDMIVLQHKN